MKNLKNTTKTIVKISDTKKRINTPAHLHEHEQEKDRVTESIKDSESQIIKELEEGIEAISHYPKSVTIFGSARLKPGSKYYEITRELAGEIAKTGHAVLTGGGPGIMQAGNQGSKEAVGTAIGFNIELPFEQVINPYVTHGVNFHFFFTRKLAMNYSGEVYICMPGGFGTMDEFFQILTLIQTKKVQKVPIILFGSEFWQPLVDFARKTMLEEFATVSKEDFDLFTITDSMEDVIEVVENAKPRQEYYDAVLD